MSWEQIQQLDPDFAEDVDDSAYPQLPAPSGERFQAFEARILEEVNHLIEDNRGPIAVVTHAGVLRVVLRHLFGCSEQEAWQQNQVVLLRRSLSIGEKQMSIATKHGDAGQTGLAGGIRISKADLRVEAYGICGRTKHCAGFRPQYLP